MPDHTLSWDRVLPAPHALLNGLTNDLLPRRNSSLLQHHLISSKDLLDSSKDRRSTVPSISYYLEPRVSPVRPISLRHSQDSSTSGQPAAVPLTRKRAALLMADELNTRETSPATTQDSISETANQFCLCQPDPKIPRPRNGMSLSLFFLSWHTFLVRPFTSLYSALCVDLANGSNSLYSLSPASPSCCCSKTPRPAQS